MADTAPLPETSAASGKVGEALGKRLRADDGGRRAACRCWESQGVRWKQEAPAADDRASGIRLVCCLRDFKCSAQINLLTFTVSGRRAIYSSW